MQMKEVSLQLVKKGGESIVSKVLQQAIISSGCSLIYSPFTGFVFSGWDQKLETQFSALRRSTQ